MLSVKPEARATPADFRRPAITLALCQRECPASMYVLTPEYPARTETASLRSESRVDWSAALRQSIPASASGSKTTTARRVPMPAAKLRIQSRYALGEPAPPPE